MVHATGLRQAILRKSRSNWPPHPNESGEGREDRLEINERSSSNHRQLQGGVARILYERVIGPVCRRLLSRYARIGAHWSGAGSRQSAFADAWTYRARFFRLDGNEYVRSSAPRTAVLPRLRTQQTNVLHANPAAVESRQRTNRA